MGFKGYQFPNLPKTFKIYRLILLFLMPKKQDTHRELTKLQLIFHNCALCEVSMHLAIISSLLI